MQKRLLALAAVVAFCLQALSAGASPGAALSVNLPNRAVVQVLGFCGLGFHRASDGRCYPNGPISAATHPAPPVAAPQAAVPVVCPEGTHLRSDGRVCTPTY